MNSTPVAAAQPQAARPVFSGDRPTRSANPEPAAAMFAELLAHARVDAPFALAVSGPAGAGKSSFLDAVLTRAEALAAAAKGQPRSPFVSQLLAVRLDAAAAGGDPASALAQGLEQALRRAGGDWAARASEASLALADPHEAARAAGERFDAIRRRLDEETNDLETQSGRRARLSDLLLYETAGSKVDSYARGNRSRLEQTLRRFGFKDADATVAYKNLVGEIAELGGPAKATPTLLRSLWAFRGQKRLLALAALLALGWLGLGLAQETQASWTPWLREQGAFGATAVDWLLTRGWIGTLRIAALAGAGLALLANLWRALRFTSPLMRGARLLKTDVAERAAELDQQIATRRSRLEALRGEAETAHRQVEETTRRAAQAGGRAAPAHALAPAAKAETFLAELDAGLTAGQGARVVVALDGLERLAPAEALRFVETAARALAGPRWALVAALDTELIGAAGDAAPARRARFERLFQAGWRLDGEGFDAARALSQALGEPDRLPAAPAPPDATRSLLDEPMSPAESDLLARLASLAGPTPRAVKRFANLYRLARLQTPDRAAAALALALETGAPEADATAILAALGRGEEQPAGDPSVVEAVRASRAAAGGLLGPAQFMAARRLARRLNVATG